MDDDSTQHWSLRRGVSWSVTLVIVAAAVGVILFARTTDGRPAPDLYPTQIRTLSPEPGAQVPRQAPVVVVVAPDWAVSLSVNGIPIPDDELDVRASVGEYVFEPGADRILEELRPGRVCAAAVVRPLVDEADPVSHEWCFTAI